MKNPQELNMNSLEYLAEHFANSMLYDGEIYCISTDCYRMTERDYCLWHKEPIQCDPRFFQGHHPQRQFTTSSTRY